MNLLSMWNWEDDDAASEFGVLWCLSAVGAGSGNGWRG